LPGTGSSRVALAIAFVVAVAAPGPGRAQTAAPAFSGRYRLVLTPSRTCTTIPAAAQSVVFDLQQAAVGSRFEVSGSPASAADADGTVLVLLRQADRLHGPVAVRTDLLGPTTLEGFRVWIELMLDGAAATATGGRARASGTAFGQIDVSRPGDPLTDTIGFCVALDHQWALEPQ